MASEDDSGMRSESGINASDVLSGAAGLVRIRIHGYYVCEPGPGSLQKIGYAS
jgi:hypothetical protein